MIVGDWGTTRLRLFRSARAGAEKLVGPGIGQLRASPAQTLRAMLEPWTSAAAQSGVLLCGMVSSRNGLLEVPYVPAPAGLPDLSRSAARPDGFDYPVWIATGMSCRNFAGQPDVMRGEETQVFGAMAIDPQLAVGDHLLVLPGTHSKWVHVVDGLIRSFHTFFTGELFALLRDHSTLVRAGADPGKTEEGFAAGLQKGRTSALAGLFTARAAQLVDDRTQGWALGFLSGLLIAGEIDEARALLMNTGSRVIVIGDPSLSALYRQAGEALGLKTALLDGDACVLAGLEQIANALERTLM